MKIKQNILFLSVAALLTTSCSDFLSPEAPSSFYPDYVFSNTGDAKKALLGVYAQFATDDYTSRMSNVWMQNTDVEATAPSANPDGSRRDIWSLQGGLLTNWSEMDSRWQNNYLTIDRANQCIEGMLASPEKDNPDMKMMIAEAYCLRAYRYFLLCNFWGDVPYFREAAKYGMELDRPKTDKNVIYSGMIQDLVDGESDMYYMDQFSDGVERMNREFALGMIARLSLFRAGYGMTKEGVMKRADDYLDVANDPDLAVTYTLNGQTKTARTSKDYYELAAAYCKKLLNERPAKLTADFGKIFRDECEQVVNSSGEVLYEVAFGTGTTNSRGDVGWCVGVAVTGGAKGTTTIQVYFTPTYYYSFDPKDLRRDVTCSLVSYSSDIEQRIESATTMTAGKWNRLWMKNDQGKESSKSTGINWPLMRYSDIVLMLAEAENEVNDGPSALAKDMLRFVRTRAFGAADQAEKVNNYVNRLASKEDFFNAIVNERAWEFGGECLRKFDLVRWNIYGKKIVETKQAINNIGKAARGLELDNPEVAKYANLADVVYYERLGGTIVFLNTPDHKAAKEPVEAITESAANGYVDGAGHYAKKDWAKALYKEITATDGTKTYEPADYTQWSWRGYKDESGQAPVPYLLPIGTSTISSSTVLNNNGYGHIFTN
ncbi:MAG: RagB/SusD family nutrient uptake outer membrane protein [Dysgonamonadaceae bacterium]|jgi:tetratricopeptide (TPR) repeat protein|nr:RagB/SusD family nutrient uptake outer membrane protein [Dysgonamonadaceae bacterium]